MKMLIIQSLIVTRWWWTYLDGSWCYFETFQNVLRLQNGTILILSRWKQGVFCRLLHLQGSCFTLVSKKCSKETKVCNIIKMLTSKRAKSAGRFWTFEVSTVAEELALRSWHAVRCLQLAYRLLRPKSKAALPGCALAKTCLLEAD